MDPREDRHFGHLHLSHRAPRALPCQKEADSFVKNEKKIMNLGKGPRRLFEVGVEFSQALLPLHYLDALCVVAHEENDEQRLRFIRLNLTWPTILGIAVGISEQQKKILVQDGEVPFRTGGHSPLTAYFSDALLIGRHYLLAHNLYWSLHPQYIQTNNKWPMAAMVMRFFRPDYVDQAGADNDYVTIDDHMNTMHRILNVLPPASQGEAFAMAVGLYRYSRNALKKRYEICDNVAILKVWTKGPKPMRKAWQIPEDSFWNLSRVWWESAIAYVDAMMERYDVRLDFTQHSIRSTFPGREIAHILSLGKRVLYYVAEDVDTGDIGVRAADHCAEWMMGTQHGRYVDSILALKAPVSTMFRELLRCLFLRRLDLNTQWNAAASRGRDPGAEGHYIGRLVYLEKK